MCSKNDVLLADTCIDADAEANASPMLQCTILPIGGSKGQSTLHST